MFTPGMSVYIQITQCTKNTLILPSHQNSRTATKCRCTSKVLLLCQINKLSEPLLHNKVRATLNKYFDNVDDTVVSEITSAVSERNMMAFCAKDRPLGTAKRRAAYQRKEFPLVSPIEYVVEKGKKPLAYVPIIPMLNKTDVLDKAMSEKVHVLQEYTAYADGSTLMKILFLQTMSSQLLLVFTLTPLK